MVSLPAGGLINKAAPEQAAALGITGVRYLPVLMGDTSEKPGTHAAGNLASELFGSCPSGSMTDYYQQISYGQFNVSQRKST